MPLEYQSWGRFPAAKHNAVAWDSRFANLPLLSDGQSLLPYGLGRSYGDSCLNDGHSILPMAIQNRFINFDAASGVLQCEAGVSLEEILKFAVPQGWFLPVTPGTKYVTVGGAIANDIHGKNHHCDGTFGHHVTRLELVRSDGSRVLCSPEQSSELFYATIGGLGLTGIITWAEFKLRRIFNPFISQEIIKFHNLREFFALSSASERDFTYTVSWIDCVAKGEQLGRGLFIRGNHAGSFAYSNPYLKVQRKKAVPFDFPSWALNPLSVKIFNNLYFHRQLKPEVRSIVSYDPFFYPLDSIHHWNRIYGKRGFLQWQCVVPFSDGQDAIAEILRRIAQTGLASFLAVLKTFGNIPSLGLLSFPRPGVTLALDFPNVGKPLFRLLDELDEIVCSARGAIYPAKDARMSPWSFRQFYPRLEEFVKYKDPQFSSSLWRRLTEE
jgi:FAD/FMN-containing dehydrogenase